MISTIYSNNPKLTINALITSVNARIFTTISVSNIIKALENEEK